MANLIETNGVTYPEVRQIENGELQAGGPNGLWNEHAKAFVERTNHLKRRIEDLATRAALEVTVGVGGHFPTIGAAMSYLSDRRQAYVPGGASVTARLLSGFVMMEQVLVSSVDLSWVTILSQDPEVTIRRSALVTALSEGAAAFPAFGAQAGGALPRIGCLFNMDGTGPAKGRHGISLISGSRASVAAGAGIKNSGGHGISATIASIVAANSAIFTGTIGDGVNAFGGSVINVAGATITGGAGYGVIAQNGARIIAVSAALTGNVLGGARATTGAEVVANLANCRTGASDSSNDIYVLTGGRISANGATGGKSQAVNTITANGLIFA